MKQCPKCKRTYTDETLNFCLEDGEWLLNGIAEGETQTAILPAERTPSEAPTRAQEAVQTQDTDNTVTKIRRHKLGLSIALAFVAVLIATVAFVIPRLGSSGTANNPTPAMKVTRLTSSGRVFFPAISPDGKYVAYMQRSVTEKESLWVRQVSAASEIQILPEEEGVSLGGVAFDPPSEAPAGT